MRTIINVSSNILSGTLDLLECLGIMTLSLVGGVFRLFSHVSELKSLSLAIRVLAPRGVLAPIMRVNLELKLGNDRRAEEILVGILQFLEEEYDFCEDERDDLRQVNAQLIAKYVRMLLSQGRMEHAAAQVIKANRKFALTELPGFRQFDAKTAHIVRAGLAASKLLDEGGLATLTIKPVLDDSSAIKTKITRRRSPVRPKNGSNVIPFPGSPSDADTRRP